MINLRLRFTHGILLMLAYVLIISSVPEQGRIRVAVFPLHPLNFVDDQGTAQGLFPDLIRNLMEKDDWDVEFIPLTWSEGLQALQNGTVDLMTTVAYSEERAKIMDFSQEAVTDIWGQIFTSSGSGVENMQDLHAKRVGIMNKDINGRNFIHTSYALGVSTEIVEYQTHDEIFAAIRRGDIIAGVAPQHYGLRHISDYDLVATSIMFSPFSVYFATKKGHNSDLLDHIDRHLLEWKEDPGSIYYQRLEYWISGGENQKGMIPEWLWWVVILGSVFSVTLLFINRYLNYQVRVRTQEIAIQEKQYRDLVEGANSVILRLDVNGKLTFINSYGVDLFGYSQTELLDSIITDNLLPEIRYPGDGLLESMNLILANNKLYKLLENEIHCKDGSLVTIQWSNKTIYDDQGAPLELLAIGTDITDKKMAEMELARYTILINAMLDGIPDAVVAIDTSNRIVTVNRAFTSILGWSENEIMGGHPSQLFANPEEYPYNSEDIGSGNSVSSLTPHVYHYVNKNREVFPAETISVPLHNEEQTPLGYITIITDITEKQSLEEQVRRSQKLEALGIMVGGIAHDFNNILQSIMLSAETALNLSSEMPELAANIRGILKDSDRARRLIRQVLTFGRKTEIELKPIRIQDVIRDALAFERSNFPSTIKITQELDENCPAVLCDEIQMHQAIINICNNAMHAMGSDEGELKVQLNQLQGSPPSLASNESSNIPRNYLELHISDTGCGMDGETSKKIFDPFFSTKTVGEGTGLGLSVVHSIMKNIDALIEVESSPGKGTTFSMWLPVTDQIPESREQNHTQPTAIMRKPVLFVDDEPSIRMALTRMLSKKGFVVDTAEDGESAFAAFKEKPARYGMVLTDLNMPKMTGVALAEAIRNSGSEVPIILSSGDLSVREMNEYKSKGINGFIQKPWSMNELLEYLANFDTQS